MIASSDTWPAEVERAVAAESTATLQHTSRAIIVAQLSYVVLVPSLIVEDKPNWYVGYRVDGRWVYKPSQQATKAQAKRWAPRDRRRDQVAQGCR